MTVRIAIGLLALFLVAALFFRAWQVGQQFLASLRPSLEKALSKSLDADVRIEDLDFTFYPSLGIAARNISIAKKHSCGAAVKAEAIILKFDYKALLQRHLRVRELEVIAPLVALSSKSGELQLQELSYNTRARGPNREAALCQVATATNKKIEDDALIATNSSIDLSIEVEAIRVRNGKVQLDLDNTFQELKITMFSSRFWLAEGRVTIREAIMKGELNDLPLQFKSSLISADTSAKTVKLKQAKLQLENLELTIDGELYNWVKPKSIEMASLKFDLSEFGLLLAQFNAAPEWVESASGDLSFDLNFSAKAEGHQDLTGSFSLSQLNLATQKLALESLAVQQFKLNFEADGKWELKIPLVLRGLKIQDGKDGYKIKRSESNFLITSSASKAVMISGDLKAAGFEFDDGATKISDATAALSKISARVSQDQGVAVSFNLSGEDIKLDHQEVQIRGFSDLKATLKIDVPAAGGYSVAGPVTVKGANISTLQRDFSQVAADIEMLVSGPLKQFVSSNLSAQLLGEKIGAVTDFAMQKDAYRLKESSIVLSPSIVHLNGQIDRNKDRTFLLEAHGQNWSLAKLAKLLQSEQGNTTEGVVESFKTNLSGNLHDPLGSLTGEFFVLLTRPISNRFNLTSAIANAVSKIPGFGSLLGLTSLQEQDTDHRVQANFSIAASKASTSDLVIRKSNYIVNMQGSVDFDLNVDARASVVFLRESISGLGAGLGKVGQLFGRVGKIEVPLFVSGIYPDLRLTPDTATFLRDNSGFTLLGEALEGTKEVGAGIGSAITSPFRGKKQNLDAERLN